MKNQRHYSKLDELCSHVDQALRAVFGRPKTTHRKYPGANIPTPVLTPKESQHVAALMRINHAGEVCAQALYHGQGFASRTPAIRDQMQQAAIEEGDHLVWCQTRLSELGSHTSYLNPIWYAGSFMIGITAGSIGDKWSLGFLAETENQVVKHIESHLIKLPVQDHKSYQILQQMREDEACHRDDAISAGAKKLPWLVKKMMALTSKMMVKTAYWL